MNTNLDFEVVMGEYDERTVDARYEMEQELVYRLAEAVRMGAMTNEQAVDLFRDKEACFRWLHESDIDGRHPDDN